MASQSAFSSLCYTKIKSSNQRLFLDRIQCSTSGVISRRKQTFPSIYAEKRVATGLKWVKELPLCRVNSNRGVTVKVGASNSDDSADGLKLCGKRGNRSLLLQKLILFVGLLLLFMSFSVSLLLGGCIRSVVTKDGLDAVLALVALYLTWPILGKDALVAVTPFLASCAAQVLFEISPKLRASSYWPLVPISVF